MTSIVWDGYVFAADRRSTHSLTNGLVSKDVYEDNVAKVITPKSDVLFEGSRVQVMGFAGDVNLGRAMEAAVSEGRDLRKLLEFAAQGKLYRNDDFVEMLIVCEDCVWSIVPTATSAQMKKLSRDTRLVRGAIPAAAYATLALGLSAPYAAMSTYLQSSSISSAIDYVCVPPDRVLADLQITTVDFKTEEEALDRFHRLTAWKYFLDKDLGSGDVDKSCRYTFLPVGDDDVLVDLASWKFDFGHRMKTDTIQALIGAGASREKLMHAFSGGLFPDPDAPKPRVKGRPTAKLTPLADSQY